ncbi:uncharacterized protein LOC131684787 [Topomyia yanbarensis]|uniref:uncharacterized protein LOC131684787 n=1 Tax=Topomyia yanbarensis TaxID=2498891 RepID=UPI00273B00A8|nr:uncharacterized protein LOC131684787 [Topomyia yanbarensis]
MHRLSIALVAVVAIVCHLIPAIGGHGMVLDPIARGSRWRCDTKAPANYDDNGLFCGGYFAQWEQNGGKCGLCGDNFADSTPRLHELGGHFGQGTIVRNYTMGAVIEVKVMITANHQGHFEFNLCDLSNGARENDACYEQIPLLDAENRRKWYLNSTLSGEYSVNLKLPEGLVCEHCVLQWTYVAGNNWGYCGDGTGRMGCGPQENFRTCSDIGIYKSSDARLAKSYSYCSSTPRSLNWIFDNIPAHEEVPEDDNDHVF